LAVFCYFTVTLIPSLREPYWAPVAAVVVLYQDLEATKKAALARFFGTIVGSLIGWGSAVVWHHDLLVYGAAVLVAVALCYLVRLESAARLCAVAVTVITLVPHTEAPHLVAFHRFVEVSYGVGCAVFYCELTGRLRRTRADPSSG